MPASTARIVLENKTLRWSSPIEFNDPFDVPRELAFDVSPNEIQRAIADKLIKLIRNRPERIDDLPNIVKVIINAVKQADSRELEDELVNGLIDELKQSKESSLALNEFQVKWRELIPELRILCLSEFHNKASMWFHYADKYKGVVLEVICDDVLDSAWLAAKKMSYPKQKPDVYTAEGWANFIFLPQQIAIKKIIELATYTKSPDWEYEDEWRVSTSMRVSDSGTISDYPLAVEEFGNLYLGPLVSDSERDILIELASGFPNMTVFNTSIGMSREFKFVEVASNKSFKRN
ncbi:DUF2971 domain-containing protein [Photobacterium phosphoreum]|jgi:hypothetical protein|nr:DUF2971 domain-containing protein [Photobacterium phosphoreum]OBU39633.1 hypothetical protein AYY25_02150 [Photobacterium phosphoreum]